MVLLSLQVSVPTPVAAGLVGQGAGCLGVCQGDAVWGAALPNPGYPPRHRLATALCWSWGPALKFWLEENSHL